MQERGAASRAYLQQWAVHVRKIVHFCTFRIQILRPTVPDGMAPSYPLRWHLVSTVAQQRTLPPSGMSQGLGEAAGRSLEGSPLQCSFLARGWSWWFPGRRGQRRLTAIATLAAARVPETGGSRWEYHSTSTRLRVLLRRNAWNGRKRCLGRPPFPSNGGTRRPASQTYITLSLSETQVRSRRLTRTQQEAGVEAPMPMWMMRACARRPFRRFGVSDAE